MNVYDHPKFSSYDKQISNEAPNWSSENWDAFWRQIIESGNNLFFLRLSQERYHAHFSLLEKLHGNKLLVVGNGITIIPQLLAVRGYQVTVVDISAVANSYCSEYEVNLEDIYNFYRKEGEYFTLGFYNEKREFQKRAAQINAIIRKPGGSTTFQTGDILEFPLESEVYDAVIIANVVDFFKQEEQRELCGKLYRCLKPGGIAIVESQQLSELNWESRVPVGIEESFVQEGFVYHLINSYKLRRELMRELEAGSQFRRNSKEKDILRKFKTSVAHEMESDLDLMKKGEKLAVFRYSK